MSHTPQWKVVSNPDTGFWEVHDSAGFLCKLESESTAQLIAAAPDLLEALRGFHPSQIKTPGELTRAWEVARAAIAKAEGRAE